MDTVVGKKFGDLTVLSCFVQEFSSAPIKMCNVICSCGIEITIQQTLLVTGKRKNCKRGIHGTRLKNLTGKTFGYWKVKEYDLKNKRWICECQCGVVKPVVSKNLVTGASQSCGCKTSEIMSRIHKKPNNIAMKNRIYKGYEGSAKRRGCEFSLTKEKFFEMIQSTCFYCGVEPETLYAIDNRNREPNKDFSTMESIESITL